MAAGWCKRPSCGQAFTALVILPRGRDVAPDLPRYCSKRCARAGEKRRAKARAAAVEKARAKLIRAARRAEQWPLSEGAATRRDFIMEKFGHRCVYCDSSERPTIDHIVPKARGGTDRISNLVVACWQCNCDKGDLPIDEFCPERAEAIVAAARRWYRTKASRAIRVDTVTALDGHG
jgi:5-methylcytosine-specific restriction endonuclease McrA